MFVQLILEASFCCMISYNYIHVELMAELNFCMISAKSVAICYRYYFVEKEVRIQDGVATYRAGAVLIFCLR